MDFITIGIFIGLFLSGGIVGFAVGVPVGRQTILEMLARRKDEERKAKFADIKSRAEARLAPASQIKGSCGIDILDCRDLI